MTSPTIIIGYVASTTSVVAFGSQFYHTMKTKTTAGLSLPRTFFDTASLSLWVLYATRVEDIPLLIATITELVFSVCVCILLLKHKRQEDYSVKDYTPPVTPPLRLSQDDAIIVVTERRNSV